MTHKVAMTFVVGFDLVYDPKRSEGQCSWKENWKNLEPNRLA